MMDTTPTATKQSPWPFMPAFALGYVAAIVLLVVFISAAVYFFNWTPPSTAMTVVPVLGGLSYAAYRWAARMNRVPSKGERVWLAAASTLVALILSVLQLAAAAPFLPPGQLASLQDAVTGGGALPVVVAIALFIMLVQFLAMYVIYGSMTKAFLKTYDTGTA